METEWKIYAKSFKSFLSLFSIGGSGGDSSNNRKKEKLFKWHDIMQKKRISSKQTRQTHIIKGRERKWGEEEF